jgi:hypothetical protein
MLITLSGADFVKVVLSFNFHALLFPHSIYLHSGSKSLCEFQVSIEYGLSEMMNAEAMGVFVSQVAPSVDTWFPDLAELEAVLPTGTIDHSTEPLYPEVCFCLLFLPFVQS